MSAPPFAVGSSYLFYKLNPLTKFLKKIFLILDKRERKGFIRLIIYDILLSLLDISFLILLLYVVQFYTHTGAPRLSLLPLQLFHSHPLWLIVLFFFLFSLKNLFGFEISRRQFRFRARVASRLSRKNILHYLEGSYEDYASIDSSIHIRKISQQPIEFCHYILGGVQQVIGQLVLIGITVTAILMYNPVLFPLLFGMLAPPVILTGFLLKKKLNTIRKMAKPLNEKTLQHLREGLSGFVESNLYGSRGFFAARYHVFQEKFNHFLSDQQNIQNLPSRLIEVFAILGLLILVLINSYTAHTNTVSLLTIGAFMAGAYKIIPGIVKILNSTGQIRAYEFTLRDLPTDLRATSIKKTPVSIPIRSIECRHISFDYGQKPVLSCFSLVMSGGEIIGISGVSGKGKTTLINLLLGFLDPATGSIVVNGACTDARARQQYWNSISYTKQQTFLIHDSILRNITLSDTVDSNRLTGAMAATGLDCLVAQYPEGVHTILTENGKNISGGQRQLIVLARALYKEADLIILDEPFNELDPGRETKLLDHFTQLAQSGKIVLLVTHNKESLRRCTKIISLDEK